MQVRSPVAAVDLCPVVTSAARTWELQRLRSGPKRKGKKKKKKRMWEERPRKVSK